MFFSFGSIANEIFVLKISFDAANRRQIILHACIKGFTISGKRYWYSESKIISNVAAKK